MVSNWLRNVPNISLVLDKYISIIDLFKDSDTILKDTLDIP